MLLSDPQAEVAKIISFFNDVFVKNGKQKAIIAVSGGIDSSLTLSLLAQALPNKGIFPIFLPYGDQDMSDAKAICEFADIPAENLQSIDIKPMADKIIEDLKISDDNKRKGNVMARVRMIVLYDLAKSMDALVCGTENRTEKYLGYYTRYGDEASDMEPIQHLYKTQIRQLAQHFQLPSSIQTKAPSAGLWAGQTDEQEFGFTYEQADLVLEQYFDLHKRESEMDIPGVDKATIDKVIDYVEANWFKHLVPYKIEVRDPKLGVSV